MFSINTPQHVAILGRSNELHLFPVAPAFQSGTLVLTPYDGRQYVLHFAPLSNAGAEACGHTPGAILFSYLVGTNQYRSAAFDHAPHRHYIAEKMGVTYAESVMLERALRFLFNAEDIGPFGEA